MNVQRLQQNAKPAGMVLLIRDHTDQLDVVLKCVEAVRRREDRPIDPQDFEPPAGLTAAVLDLHDPGLTNSWLRLAGDRSLPVAKVLSCVEERVERLGGDAQWSAGLDLLHEIFPFTRRFIGSND